MMLFSPVLSVRRVTALAGSPIEASGELEEPGRERTWLILPIFIDVRRISL